MSALTDLFTALANKIRSKTGGSTTYTPPQMVNAIDDVYQAGVDAGETPTQTKTVTAGTSAVTVTPDAGYALSSVTVNPTPSQSKSATPTTSAQTITPDSGKLLSSVSVGAIPSEYVIPTSITPNNTSPVFMEMGSAYKPSGSGYAISSYDSEDPSLHPQTPLGHYAGEMIKFESNGYIIDSYQNVTPSDSSPASLTSGNIYKANTGGYAISSYSSITPSSSGTYFSSGMKKMASSGYAYSSRPQMTETTLWTNSATTSNYTENTITLSSSLSQYDYIKVYYYISKTVQNLQSVMKPVSEFIQCTTTNPSFSFVCTSTFSGTNHRRLLYVSNTQIKINHNYSYSSGSTTYDQNNIPYKICGCKL